MISYFVASWIVIPDLLNDRIQRGTSAKDKRR